MVLAAFSPRGDQFAIGAGDGRLKTWDVASGHVCAEFSEIAASSSQALDGHLALNYKSLAWGASSKKKKKKASLIVLGTGGGDVLAWDPILGELTWRTNDCNTGGVTSVCFAKNQGSLFSAGIDGIVCELEVASGKILSTLQCSKSSITNISSSPDASLLLVAANELRLFDMRTRKRLRKFTGHASSVNVTVFTEDGRYVLSAAVGDRNIAVWDTNEVGKEAKVALAMEHPAVALDSWGFEKDGTERKILAVSETGEAYIWSGLSLEELGKAEPVRVRVGSKNSGKASKQSILLGRLVGAGSVVVARGTTVRPSFETVALPEEGVVVLPPSEQGNLLLSQSEPTIKRGGHDVTVLGADNAADASLPKPRIEAGDVKKRKRREANVASEAEPSQGMEEDKADGATPMEEDKDEQTMEERLMALGLVEDKRTEGNAFENAEVVPPKSDSLEVLFTQAMRSDDKSLIEQCLCVSDTKVITNTVRSLSPKDACTLLRLAISRLEESPRRGLQLLPWIRITLLEHASYIMSNIAIQPVLKSLYQVVESRLHIFRPLLALSGRLDLIVAKIKANETSKSVEQAEVATAVYEEDEEEDSDQEVEDAMADEDEDEDEEEEEEERMDEDKPHLENGGSFSDDESDQSND
ncbi:WD repeat-containing protein 43 isoform X2 [Selaginella moellendorffii]|uniref:WD repeat-containing protein 43 isoform X2 n=1 Tax=Selaginella moellendorffii TaxID=88036 RepID=UPI000D1C94EB|nr:WD repeat-containing protein 43 isoform X2 [Selaginella moellendorffii]|eukprot:XP_024519578.1 WD repeat-containing protein 43 isoform X2 [Selaginella moellendorffii]